MPDTSQIPEAKKGGSFARKQVEMPPPSEVNSIKDIAA